jgi:hypothetical protein
MKQIGAQIGVNESRVSQLHARAIRRMRDALGDMGPEQVAELRLALGITSITSMTSAPLTTATTPPLSTTSTRPVFVSGKSVMLKAKLPANAMSPVNKAAKRAATYGIVLPYNPGMTKAAPARAILKMSRPRHASAAAR